MTRLKDIKPALDLSEDLRDSIDTTVLRSLVDRLADANFAKLDKKGIDAKVEKAEAPFRAWLKEHPDDIIEDGDHIPPLLARLEPNGESVTYDIPAAVEARLPALYRRLVELGCLSWDTDRIEKAIEDGLVQKGDVDPIRIRGAKTKFYLGQRREKDPK